MRKLLKKAAALALAAAMMIPATGISASAADDLLSISASKYGQCRYETDATDWEAEWTINTNNRNSDTNRGNSTCTAEYNYAQKNKAEIMPATYFDISDIQATPIKSATVHFEKVAVNTACNLAIYSLPVTSEWAEKNSFKEYEEKQKAPCYSIMRGNSSNTKLDEETPTAENGISFDVTDYIQGMVDDGETYAGFAVYVADFEKTGKVTLGTGNDLPTLVVEYASTYTVTVNEAGQSVATYENVEYNQKVTVTETSDKFSYWEKDGKIISYDKTYSFYAYKDVTVNAVLNGEVADPKPVCNLTYDRSGDKTEIYVEYTAPTSLNVTNANTGLYIGKTAEDCSWIESETSKPKKFETLGQFKVTVTVGSDKEFYVKPYCQLNEVSYDNGYVATKIEVK